MVSARKATAGERVTEGNGKRLWNGSLRALRARGDESAAELVHGVRGGWNSLAGATSNAFSVTFFRRDCGK
jgi:hypothetical protein